MWWTDANTHNHTHTHSQSGTPPTPLSTHILYFHHPHRHTQCMCFLKDKHFISWSLPMLPFQHNCQPHWECVGAGVRVYSLSSIWSSLKERSSSGLLWVSFPVYLVSSLWRDFNLVSTRYHTVSNFRFPGIVMYGEKICAQWGVWLEMQFTWQLIYIRGQFDRYLGYFSFLTLTAPYLRVNTNDSQ